MAQPVSSSSSKDTAKRKTTNFDDVQVQPTDKKAKTVFFSVMTKVLDHIYKGKSVLFANKDSHNSELRIVHSITDSIIRLQSDLNGGKLTFVQPIPRFDSGIVPIFSPGDVVLAQAPFDREMRYVEAQVQKVDSPKIHFKVNGTKGGKECALKFHIEINMDSSTRLLERVLPVSGKTLEELRTICVIASEKFEAHSKNQKYTFTGYRLLK